jgi:ribonuclease HII
MLKLKYRKNIVEAGCDEAGRGCLAGPVFAAAVILPDDYTNSILNDSKQLSEKQRDILRVDIEKNSLSWAVASYSPAEIDEVNILNASFLSMHRAIDNLTLKPELLLIDGNRFIDYKGIKHICVIKGDSKYMSIAAASVLAKTHRDEYMLKMHSEFPHYHWDTNKGYPTKQHKLSIIENGYSKHHRKSFNANIQTKLEF